MYKLLEKPDKEAIWDNGVVFHPVATLGNEYGGRAQIAVDDHCFVLLLRYLYADGEDGISKPQYRYRPVSWIFKEAAEAIAKLPHPPDAAWDLIRGGGKRYSRGE